MAKAVGQSLWLKGLRDILVVGVLVLEFRHVTFGSFDTLVSEGILKYFGMFSVLGIRDILVVGSWCSIRVSTFDIW